MGLLVNRLHLLVGLPALRAAQDMAHQPVVIPRASAFPSQLLKLLKVEALALRRATTQIVAQLPFQRCPIFIPCFSLSHWHRSPAPFN
jgi:hypothetical protein